MEDAFKELGGEIIGKWNDNHYRIIKKLGKGGTAEVFLVEGEGKKYFAMKVSQDSLSLNREYQLLQKFSDNPSVVKVYEIDDFSLRGSVYHFLILDYIQGENLKVHTEKKQIKRITIFGIILIILKILESFHRKGYILGDLKLENIMFDQSKKEIKLIDLGGVVEMGKTVKEYTPAYDRGAWRCGLRRAEASYDLFTLTMILIRLIMGEKLSPVKQKKEEIVYRIKNLDENEQLKSLMIEMLKNQAYSIEGFAKRINELYNIEKLRLVKKQKKRRDILINYLFTISLGLFVITGCILLMKKW